MSPPTQNDEPVTSRVTKAVEEKMGNMERRSYDRAWAVIQPVAVYMLCGLIAGSLALWQGQTTQGQKISELGRMMTKLEEKVAILGTITDELRRETVDMNAYRDELNRWRNASDRRVDDLTTMGLSKGKPR